jgi:hypothetical protein
MESYIACLKYKPDRDPIKYHLAMKEGTYDIFFHSMDMNDMLFYLYRIRKFCVSVLVYKRLSDVGLPRLPSLKFFVVFANKKKIVFLFLQKSLD